MAVETTPVGVPAMLSSSTWSTIMTATTNSTSFLAPSSRDLLMVVPRMAAKAGSFVTSGLPAAYENIFGGGITGRAIAAATAQGINDVIPSTAPAVAGTMADTLPIETAAVNATTMQDLLVKNIRAFGGIFSYITSKWALGCFAAAVILNRTGVYAAPRRHIRLDWQLRAAIRIIPIILLLQMAASILRALRCQTSPEYPLLRFAHLEEPKRPEMLDDAGEGGLFYRAATMLLFWESDVASCKAINMIASEDASKVKGSLSLLWPAFLTLCLSQFTESLSCTLEGRPVATETGMSLFEHSLAFAEAEAMIGAQIAFSSTKAGKTLTKLLNIKEDSTSILTPLKGYVLARCNTTPEVLIMSLISCMNSLSSHVLGVFGMQARYRLVNTGIWAMCFLTSFLWCFRSFSLAESLDSGLLRFPTVCVVGFIPHLIIMVGIIVCACIYALAVLLSTLAIHSDRGLLERFRLAYRNMQVHLQLSGIRFRMSEDFYTSLLKIGFTALTAASEAVFLNEGRRVNVGHWTWLEEEKMTDIVRARDPLFQQQNNLLGRLQGRNTQGQIRSRAMFGPSGGLLSGPNYVSGYSVERDTKTLKNSRSPAANTTTGVGYMQRGGRYVLALNYWLKIIRLMVGWTILVVLRFLSLVGIAWRPVWLRRMLGIPKMDDMIKPSNSTSDHKELDFWLITDEGEIVLPRNRRLDVAHEMRKRILSSGKTLTKEIDAELDEQTYSWFKHGGWWGDIDRSASYVPPVTDQDDDTTSVISSSTDLESDWDTELSSGQLTPTKSNPYPDHTSQLDTTQLARLLNPQSAEDRQEARLLGARIARDGPLTRSQYSRLNTSVLISTTYRPAGFTPSDPTGKLTPEEEAEVLESLILRFRDAKRKSTTSGVASWNEGAEGLGAGGPMCVVCQTTPRTILAWPCRCLSLCEDCRVSLAMNNFGSCVCCRQEVVGFSRLFVP